MTVEAAGFIDDIDPTQPPGTDNFSEGDDHLRNFKKSVQDSFPNISGAMTATEAELNIMDGVTSTTAEVNILDGVTATTAELNFVDGVTSDIQTQINEKANGIFSITGTVAASALTAGLAATDINFRSATITDGAPVSRNVPSALSLVVASGATLGTTDAVQSKIVLLAIDNAGTVELAVVNDSAAFDFNEDTLITTTTIGAGSDSTDVAYSTSARTDVAFRVVGYIESTQATAGTWATSPSTLQGGGGNVNVGLLGDLSTVTGITESVVDWTNNAGISNFIKSRDGLIDFGAQAFAAIGTFYVFIPASANSVEYYIEMENIGASVAPRGRINTSTNNGATLSNASSVKEWTGAGTLDISDKSGWTLITVQGGHTTGTGGSDNSVMYNICMRFI